ncbi:MAG: hypothetical protein VXX50_01480, partial [Candidatus Thermoplasmatota archaeon]|nr:hypothetical protein [Candidatus Thermoplasmatota archaeon]
DRDGDGCGDNYTYATDNDGYRTPASGDAFPNDFSQCIDLDGDGFGDNYTFSIDPTTGLRIESGDLFPFDFLAHGDPDNDGCVPESSTGLPYDHDSSDPLVCEAPEEETENGNNSDTSNETNDVVCPTVLCWDGSTVDPIDCSCPLEIIEQPSDNSPSTEEDLADSEKTSPALFIVLILGTIALLGVIGVVIVSRLSDNNSQHKGTEEVCPHCNGPIQEAVANGGNWTWCPSCRKWLEYKGPAN